MAFTYFSGLDLKELSKISSKTRIWLFENHVEKVWNSEIASLENVMNNLFKYSLSLQVFLPLLRITTPFELGQLVLSIGYFLLPDVST